MTIQHLRRSRASTIGSATWPRAASCGPRRWASSSRFVYGRLEEQKVYFEEQTASSSTTRPRCAPWSTAIEAEPGKFESLARDMQHPIKGEFPLPVRLAELFMVLAEEEGCTRCCHAPEGR